MRFRKNKNENKNKIIIGIVVAIFLVSSIAGVVLYRSDSTPANTNIINLAGKDYNIEQKLDNFGSPYYLVSDKTEKFNVYYLPSQISYIMDNETQNYLKSLNYYYLAFNPDDENIQYMDFLRFDLRQNLPTTIYFADAVTESSDKYALPVVTCENASVNSPIIILQSSNKTHITIKDNCIVMDFAQYDTLRVRDSFIYLSRGVLLK